MVNLKNLINEYLEIEETEENAERIHEMGHELEHAIYDAEFLIPFNKAGDEEELVTLIFEEDGSEFFFIPVYTDEDELNLALEEFKKEADDAEFGYDRVLGGDLVEMYSDDEEFAGIAVNYPQCEFMIEAEFVHTC